MMCSIYTYGTDVTSYAQALASVVIISQTNCIPSQT